MQKLGTERRLALLLGIVALVAALAAVGARRSDAAPDSSSATRQVVRTVQNGKLDKTVVVDRRGMTLYTLSAETRGRFVCTGACLSLWTPLVVARGTAPTGAKLLATVRRPDGRTQVTYRGRPLYTFVRDRKPGDAKGDGFRDVGVWHPAGPTATTSTPAAGGGYGGLYG